jgi:hypothetical protein
MSLGSLLLEISSKKLIDLKIIKQIIYGTQNDQTSYKSLCVNSIKNMLCNIAHCHLKQQFLKPTWFEREI